MKQALTTRRMMVILLIIIPISACMRVPSGYLSHSDPVLWMYQTSFSDEGTVLYMQEAGGEVRRIAGGVLPGSHREWNGNILFLRDQEELWYAGAGQAPYKLLESIQPYQYGFMDNGRRLYAITDQYELVFKAFGREAQVVGERIVHVLPLEHRLLAQRDDGTILSLDWTGQSHVLVKGAVSLESAGDSRYAIIRRDDGLLVTNGEEIHYSIHSETIGPLTITPNGQAVWYLDEFDIEAGSGVLKMVEAEDSLPIRVAEQVTSYSVQTPEEIWYTSQDDLYVYHTKHQFHRHMIGSVDNIVYIADASMYGEAAVTLADGSLVFLDETGTAHDVELPGPVVWIEVFASGLVCKIEGGAIYYVGLGDVQWKELGLYDEWVVGPQHLIAIHQSKVTAIDVDLNKKQLMQDIEPYKYVYYGEKLLSERLLRLTDIAGGWRAVEDENDRIKIYAFGKRRGGILLPDGEAAPFIVRYATADSMKLTMTGTATEPLTVLLDREGRLVLFDGELKMVYVRDP